MNTRKLTMEFDQNRRHFLGALAIRARVPLPVLRDVIQPFPTFSEIYVAALKALTTQIAAARQPDGALAAS